MATPPSPPERRPYSGPRPGRRTAPADRRTRLVRRPLGPVAAGQRRLLATTAAPRPSLTAPRPSPTGPGTGPSGRGRRPPTCCGRNPVLRAGATTVGRVRVHAWRLADRLRRCVPDEYGGSPVLRAGLLRSAGSGWTRGPSRTDAWRFTARPRRHGRRARAGFRPGRRTGLGDCRACRGRPHRGAGATAGRTDAWRFAARSCRRTGLGDRRVRRGRPHRRAAARGPPVPAPPWAA